MVYLLGASLDGVERVHRQPEAVCREVTESCDDGLGLSRGHEHGTSVIGPGGGGLTFMLSDGKLLLGGGERVLVLVLGGG